MKLQFTLWQAGSMGVLPAIPLNINPQGLPKSYISNNMKKHLIFFFAGILALAAFSACQKDDDNNSDNPPTHPSLVGEWSGLRDGSIQPGTPIDDATVTVHFSFRADGTFSMIMPAWDEQRDGKYTLDGNKITLNVTKLQWVIDPRPYSSYNTVYAQYGVDDIEGWKAELDRPLCFIESAVALSKPLFDDAYDIVVLVDSDYARRLERNPKVASRAHLQHTSSEIEKANFIISNNSTKENLYSEVDEILKTIENEN